MPEPALSTITRSASHFSRWYTSRSRSGNCKRSRKYRAGNTACRNAPRSSRRCNRFLRQSRRPYPCFRNALDLVDRQTFVVPLQLLELEKGASGQQGSLIILRFRSCQATMGRFSSTQPHVAANWPGKSSGWSRCATTTIFPVLGLFNLLETVLE